MNRPLQMARRPVSVRQALRALPVAERLEIALWLVDELCGADQRLADLQAGFGLTNMEARVLGFLDANAGKLVTKEAIHAAMHPTRGAETDIRIVDVYICKLRAKLPAAVPIRTVWGAGYRVDARPEVPGRPVADGVAAPGGIDADILQMLRNGSDMAAICAEVGLTQVSVTRRLRQMADAGVQL